jgi:hypothetical protein
MTWHCYIQAGIHLTKWSKRQSCWHYQFHLLYLNFILSGNVNKLSSFTSELPKKSTCHSISEEFNSGARGVAAGRDRRRYYCV